jgi:hypothetical protein
MESRSEQPNHYYRNEQDTEPQYPRHRPSAIGHWTRTLGALVPLVIGELVKEPEKKWRFIRVASVALAVINEASYAYAVQQDRKERDARRERR